MCVCFGDPCAQNFKLRDYFERILCWLDHWLSCMLDCIHDCVFLLSKKWFLKVARFLLDTSSTPCYLSSFLSLFLSQSRQLLDTWWINQECSNLLDSFSTPSGSIELLFLDLIPCCSIPQLSTSIFSTPISTASSTPPDTSSIELYWRFYLNLLVRSDSHFTRSLSRLFSVFSLKLSHLTPISILKGFFKLFQDFLLLVSF